MNGWKSIGTVVAIVMGLMAIHSGVILPAILHRASEEAAEKFVSRREFSMLRDNVDDIKKAIYRLEVKIDNLKSD
ncbi:MAG: hypothetical protein ACXABY_13995 [Candidatus Thorarchaeota archaeon]|jgi:hypothetical protein